MDQLWYWEFWDMVLMTAITVQMAENVWRTKHFLALKCLSKTVMALRIRLRKRRRRWCHWRQRGNQCWCPVFHLLNYSGRRWWPIGNRWRDSFTLHICVDSTSKLSFPVIQQLVLDIQTSRLFGGGQFALKVAALPQRSAHVDPHTASMRPNEPTGHVSMAGSSFTPRWRHQLSKPSGFEVEHEQSPRCSHGLTPQHELSWRPREFNETPRNLHPSLQGHRQDEVLRRRHWSSKSAGRRCPIPNTRCRGE